MTSVTEDTGIEMDCSEIADLLHKNIDCVWEKAMVCYLLKYLNKEIRLALVTCTVSRLVQRKSKHFV